jgi:hypothetical protein
MANTGSLSLNWALLVAIGVALFMGCAKRNAAISQTEMKHAAQGVPAPNIAETKAIAEEGFIYGLPLVMNYAIMTAYSLDPKEVIKTHFFEYLDFALQFLPPLPEETDIRAKLARIGIGTGRTFDFEDLSAEHKAAALLGMKDGEGKIDAAIKNFGVDINGWNVAAVVGDHSFYNGDCLKRAAAAKFGISRTSRTRPPFSMAGPARSA